MRVELLAEARMRRVITQILVAVDVADVNPDALILPAIWRVAMTRPWRSSTSTNRYRLLFRNDQHDPTTLAKVLANFGRHPTERARLQSRREHRVSK